MQTMVCDPLLQRRLDFGEAKSNIIILVVVEFVNFGLFFMSEITRNKKLNHKMGEGVV